MIKRWIEKNSYEKDVALAYRNDLLDCIEKAKQVQLSPYWQRYCLEDIAQSRGTACWPRGGGRLLKELRRVLAAVPQITNEEEERRAMEALGGELLYYYSTDRFTVMEITRFLQRACYTATVCVERQDTPENTQARLQQLRTVLDGWAAELDLVPPDEMPPPAWKADTCADFSTAEDALRYLYACLACPQEIFC